MRISIRLIEGERIATGYRIAYYDLMKNQLVCYPFGMHLIVRWLRRLWQMTYYYKPSRVERICRKAVADVKYALEVRHRKDLKEAREFGYVHGWKACQEQLERIYAKYTKKQEETT